MKPRVRLTGLFLAMTAVGIFAGVSMPREPRQERPGLQVTTLPSCSDGQFLVYRGGQVVCETVSAGTMSWPDCTGKLLSTKKNGDISQLTCVNKGGGQ